MKRAMGMVWGAIFLAISSASAADLSVARLDQPAPTEGVDAAITETLATTGYKITSGKRTVAEIWPCRAWTTKADFKPTVSIGYPFESGQLMGLIRYPRKGGDFRGQEIPAGLYTLRYALQPVDGNHVGTSETRDFLLLLPVADDASAETLKVESLHKISKKSAGGTHPTMLSLLAAPAADVELPAMKHDENRELWSLQFSGTTSGDKPSEVRLTLVVQGKAEG